MAEHHSPRERFMLYQSGWKAGAASRLRNEQRKDDADYEEGYGDGRHAYSVAMTTARDTYGAPPPSILRTKPQHVQDLEDQADEEMFAAAEDSLASP